MEAGPTHLVAHEPAHPYTRALLSAAPVADPEVQRQRRSVTAAAARPTPPGSR
ncbi:ABC transporter ATP-binding protein [Streptomyces akebiae]|uniref:Oligopeptide/dipeptide ABC transporter C-terminal domain-containing protein n=1 Tax=Streptomyces akebiae TaxID=2865673 RepID=A0ABX8XIB6_9ACTN|nr:hypothetical protein [Streptomyces akebiae]QYX75691.1 hypothetical protein K1J60_03415 [Streptomyces akebiae]